MADNRVAQELTGRRVALHVGGGIAAYRACELARELGRRGALVRVAMTEAATRFVTPLTLEGLTGHPVLEGFLKPSGDGPYGHLDLARWADTFVVAPATADLIAKIRAGMADSVVTASILAFPGPIVLAPAMNTAMWESPATKENIAALRRRADMVFVGPNFGLLADGDVGLGRLAEVAEIATAVGSARGPEPLRGKYVMVTAGPTREALDPVRYISSPATGRMGIAIAAEAQRRGAHVCLILGPTEVAPPAGVEVVGVSTAVEMCAAATSRALIADYVIATAAVSDFRPQSTSVAKVKKDAQEASIGLVPNPDILATVSEIVRKSNRQVTVIGFAAETDDLERNARTKLERKRLDWIVANRVGIPGTGFASEENAVLLLGANGVRAEHAGSKSELAKWLWSFWS